MFRPKRRFSAEFFGMPNEVDLTLGVFSFLKEKHLLSEFLDSIHSRNLSPENLKAIFNLEFDINFPEDCDPINYIHITNERERFIIYLTSLCIRLSDINLDLLKDWKDCVLEQETFYPFMFNAKKELEKLSDVSKVNADNTRTIREDNFKVFYNLLNNPAGMPPEALAEAMKLLCRVNANRTISFIFKLHPELKVDLSFLLREAISCLHTSTVDSLLEAGADIHKPVVHSNYSDYGYTFFCSPLLYALLLPLEPYCAVNSFGPAHQWDNRKLEKMIDFLISKGAKPEQNCIFTEKRVRDIEQAKERAETDVNCITISKDLIEDNKRKLDPVSLNWLNKFVNWPQAENEARPSLRM